MGSKDLYLACNISDGRKNSKCAMWLNTKLFVFSFLYSSKDIISKEFLKICGCGAPRLVTTAEQCWQHRPASVSYYKVDQWPGVRPAVTMVTMWHPVTVRNSVRPLAGTRSEFATRDKFPQDRRFQLDKVVCRCRCSVGCNVLVSRTSATSSPSSPPRTASTPRPWRWAGRGTAPPPSSPPPRSATTPRPRPRPQHCPSTPTSAPPCRPPSSSTTPPPPRSPPQLPPPPGPARTLSPTVWTRRRCRWCRPCPRCPRCWARWWCRCWPPGPRSGSVRTCPPPWCTSGDTPPPPRQVTHQ